MRGDRHFDSSPKDWSFTIFLYQFIQFSRLMQQGRRNSFGLALDTPPHRSRRRWHRYLKFEVVLIGGVDWSITRWSGRQHPHVIHILGTVLGLKAPLELWPRFYFHCLVFS